MSTAVTGVLLHFTHCSNHYYSRLQSLVVVVTAEAEVVILVALALKVEVAVVVGEVVMRAVVMVVGSVVSIKSMATNKVLFWYTDATDALLLLTLFLLPLLLLCSIMGLYASVVLVIGKFVREFFSGISHSIMFEELPCVDRILKLCTDIFLVKLY